MNEKLRTILEALREGEPELVEPDEPVEPLRRSGPSPYARPASPPPQAPPGAMPTPPPQAAYTWSGPMPHQPPQVPPGATPTPPPQATYAWNGPIPHQPPQPGAYVPPITIHLQGGEKKGLARRIVSSIITGWVARIIVSLICYGLPGWLPFMLAALLGLFGWTVRPPEKVKQAAHHVAVRVDQAVNRVKDKVGERAKVAVEHAKDSMGEVEKTVEQVKAKVETVKTVATLTLPPQPSAPSFSPQDLSPPPSAPSFFRRIVRPSANAVCGYCDELCYVPPDLLNVPVRCGSCYISQEKGRYLISHYEYIQNLSPGPPYFPPPPLPDMNKEVGTILAPLGKIMRSSPSHQPTYKRRR